MAATTAPTPTLRPTPDAFRSFVAELERPTPGLVDLARTAGDDELTALAETICIRVEPDMSTSELGAAALATTAELVDLTPTLSADEVSLVFGALAGLHCPRQLPLSGLRLDRADSRPPSAGVAGFRTTVQDLWPARHPLPELIAAIGDARLIELADGACDLANPGHSATQFGLASLAHHEGVLDDTERAALGATWHAELFGALVGWFCPERLPSIG